MSDEAAYDLFLNAEWKRLVKQAEEARAALTQALTTVTDLRQLGKIQGQIEQLPYLINYEQQIRMIDSMKDDAEALEL